MIILQPPITKLVLNEVKILVIQMSQYILMRFIVKKLEVVKILNGWLKMPEFLRVLENLKVLLGMMAHGLMQMLHRNLVFGMVVDRATYTQDLTPVIVPTQEQVEILVYT